MKTIKAMDHTTELAFSMEDGERLFKAIMPVWIETKEPITIDFSQIVLFGAPFFNALVASLLSEWTEEQLRTQMVIINMDAVGSQLLERTIVNALKYKNGTQEYRDAYDTIIKEMFDGR
jgi:hypothetical protein